METQNLTKEERSKLADVIEPLIFKDGEVRLKLSYEFSNQISYNIVYEPKFV
jgi:hypothetical protein